MNIEQLRAKRAERRSMTMAPRTEAELHALPDSAYVTPTEAALLLRISVESLMLNRARRKAPIGFKLGRVVRFTMGELRAVHAKAVPEETAA